jgi:MFS family permease
MLFYIIEDPLEIIPRHNMNEILLLLLPMGAIFLTACSIALLALGKIIDRYPQGDESARERSIASPIESTKIAVIILWAIFLPGAWAVCQENKYVLIAGITILFALCLFMFTALAFAFAVLTAMKSRRKRFGERPAPVVQVAAPSGDAAAIEVKPVAKAPRLVPEFMAAMMVKKE